MRLHTLLRFSVAVVVSLVVCFLAVRCRSTTSTVEPVIEFSVIPPADAGGPDKLAEVAGRVKGARARQRIVLFARSGGSTGHWWVQPFRSRPFTNIEDDSTWKSKIHLGTEYAALLVEPEYRPPAMTETLPPRGAAIVAMATVKGSGAWVPPPPKTVAFSGYEWEIDQVRMDRYGPNDCDARNVWVDGDGRLHLLLTQREGRVTSAALRLTRALGYGTYLFDVLDTSQLDPAAAFLMYTWDDRADHNHRELNVGISSWGDPRNKNGQYVLQYEDIAANVFRFSAPSGRLTHSFRWEPGKASFKTVRSTPTARAPAVAERQFTTGVPVPATATARLALLYVHKSQSPPTKAVEVVVEKFVHLP